MNYVIHDTGLVISSPLSLDECGILIEGLRQGKDKASWAVADALVYANDAHGDDIYQHLDDTNWSHQTIANYMTTARKIPHAVRRATVSFSNHSEVASLDPAHRDHALNMLEAKQWTRADVRNYKRELKGEEIPNEQTITLKWEQMQVRDGKLIVVFTAPLDEIVEFKAVVRKPAIKDKAA